MMTEVNQEVIDDLMPLYLAGEASPASKRLVEEFLSHHPEVASRAKLELPAAAPPPDLDRRMLDRARQLHDRQSLLLWLALACSYSVFAFRFQGREIVFQVYRDSPPLAWVLLGVALALWIAFLVTCRRLERTGLLAVPRSPAAFTTWMAGGAAALLPFGFVASHQTGVELTRDLVAAGAFAGAAVGVGLGRAVRP